MPLRSFLALLALAAAGVAAGGCAGLASDGRAPGTDTATPASARAGLPERNWTGRQAAYYERSYRICSVFSVKEVARELGVAPRPKQAARAHAEERYDPQFRRAAYQGCLDAFRVSAAPAAR